MYAILIDEYGVSYTVKTDTESAARRIAELIADGLHNGTVAIYSGLRNLSFVEIFDGTRSDVFARKHARDGLSVSLSPEFAVGLTD